MKLSIITINYNDSKSTIELLKSLESQSDSDFQTIIIDNASENSDFIDLKNNCPTYKVGQSFGRPKLIRNEENLGFSGGNNIGIKNALENGSEWIALLNNDTCVESSFISVLKAKLKHLDGIVGLPLIENDRTAYYGQIRWLKPTLKHGYSPPYSEYLRRNRSFYAIGGAMVIHRNVFDRIGFLDEEYFLYFEDADFNLRAGRANLPISFIDEPKAKHKVSETTKKLGSPLLLRYHYRNSLYFNWKNGSGYIKLLIWPWSFWIITKQLLKIIVIYKQNDSIAILKGVFDFYSNRMGKI